ncbi:MAG: transporter substrate-binding domain-containing protein [Geminicoccaceae bacterium]
MRKRLVAVLGLVAGVALLSGLARAEEKAPYLEYTPSLENCADGSLERAQKDGITMGQSGIAPHSLLDPNTKEASGIDIEINNAVLDIIGVKDRRIEWMAWGTQVPALLSKRTDVIAQNIHVNPERLKVISFSGPSWWYGPAVLVQKGNPDGIKSYDDFKGKEVGAVGGSAAEAYLTRIGANVTPFKSEVEELQSLNQGRIKYVVEDDVIFTVFNSQNPNNQIEALWDIPSPDDVIFGGGYGYARYGFRPEDCSLRAAYTAALGELRGNGFVSAVLKKYGLSDRNLFWFKLNP